MQKEFVSNDLIFKKASLSNLKHLEVIKEFKKDEDINKYFEEWLELITLSYDVNESIFAYFVYDEEKIIGLCTLAFVNDYNVVFSQGIRQECRGNNYAGKLREAAMSYLKSIGVTKMVGYLKKDHQNIINNIIRNGYEISDVTEDLYQATYLDLEKNITR